MERNFYYIGIAFFGMINGIFNPLIVFAYVWAKVFMEYPLFGYEPLIFYFASLMLSTATVILGGIPAAIYERFAGIKGDSTVPSLWIWLAGTAILTIPAIGEFPENRSLTVAVTRLLSAAMRRRYGTDASDCIRGRATRMPVRFARHFLRYGRDVI